VAIYPKLKESKYSECLEAWHLLESNVVDLIQACEKVSNQHSAVSIQ